MSKPETSRVHHFGIGRWADFARGLTSVRVTSRMSRHAEGCTPCRNLMTFCAKLAAAGHSAEAPKRFTSGNG